MGWVGSYVLHPYCDEEGCPNPQFRKGFIEVSADTKREAIERAREAGWSVGAAIFYPKHAPATRRIRPEPPLPKGVKAVPIQDVLEILRNKPE